MSTPLINVVSHNYKTPVFTVMIEHSILRFTCNSMEHSIIKCSAWLYIFSGRAL